MDKRTILLLTQAAVLLQALAIGLLISFDAISLELMFLFGIVLGGTFSFNMPARQAFIPALVPKNELMNAIALNNAAMNGTRIVGPAVAGVMIGLWGVDSAYYAQTLMYLVTLGFVIQLPRTGAHLIDAETRGTVLVEIGVGLRYIAGQRTLLMLMLNMLNLQLLLLLTMLDALLILLPLVLCLYHLLNS